MLSHLSGASYPGTEPHRHWHVTCSRPSPIAPFLRPVPSWTKGRPASRFDSWPDPEKAGARRCNTSGRRLPYGRLAKLRHRYTPSQQYSYHTGWYVVSSVVHQSHAMRPASEAGLSLSIVRCLWRGALEPRNAASLWGSPTV